jgi:hypothetical protein
VALGEGLAAAATARYQPSGTGAFYHRRLSPVQAGIPPLPRPSGSPLRPFPAFGRSASLRAVSAQLALALTLNKRFSRNFLVNASYTFSKIIDDNPDATGVVAFTDDVKLCSFRRIPVTTVDRARLRLRTAL